MHDLTAPTPRKEAREAEADRGRMSRWSLLSAGLHLLVLIALAIPASRPPKPIFADPIYEVAFIESEQPNFEPPKPVRTTPKPEPKPPAPKPMADPEPKAIPVEPKVDRKKVEPPIEKAKPEKEPLKPPVERKEVEEPPSPQKAPVPVVNTPDLPDEPVSLGSVDQKDFTHNYYLQVVRARLARAWDRPDLGAGLMKTAIHFIILRNGTVVQPFVQEPSGNTFYDRAALSAVTSTKRLPPLPESYSGDQLGITVIFEAKAE